MVSAGFMSFPLPWFYVRPLLVEKMPLQNELEKRKTEFAKSSSKTDYEVTACRASGS
jgi:hypothetical protein